MLELYQHDLSDIWDQDIDSSGEYGYDLDKYWLSPTCFPFVFLANNRYAGFCLVDDNARLEEDNIWMSQFFILKKYRRMGMGTRAANAIFSEIRGRWEVGQMPNNDSAHLFWRKVINNYTCGKFVDLYLNDARWNGFLQCFDNSIRD